MIPLLAQASVEASISMWPFAILSICVVFIVVAITMLRVHAFLALILAAVLAGILTGDLPNLNDLNKGLFDSRVALDMTDLEGNNLIKSVKWSLKGFGNTAGGIGLVIALAAIIGTCLMGSGAADRIVRSLLKVCGEKRAGIVLLMSGFLLSIPVFFDTVFFLLIPLARALSLRTGKSYTMYVIAMAGAGAITHSMVPPTPGPLMIANTLKIDLGVAIMAGLAASILPAWLVLVMAKRFDDKLNIPMRNALHRTIFRHSPGICVHTTPSRHRGLVHSRRHGFGVSLYLVKLEPSLARHPPQTRRMDGTF
ncbi:SLC13 family permease [Verrucomicrobia bacterium]|nr:SLC13 family permease [Verrucomicrobiota bacterium]